MENKDLEKRAIDTTARANEIIVTDEITLKAATEFLTAVKALAGQIKDTFAESKEAAHKAHKAVIAAEKKHLDPLVAAEAVVKDKVGTYLKARDAALRKQQEDEKLKTAQALQDAGHAGMAMQVLDTQTHVEKPKMEGVSTRKVYTFRVVDMAKLPDQFKIADTTAIRKVVNALGLKAEIPGVIVEEDVQVAVRGSI